MHPKPRYAGLFRRRPEESAMTASIRPAAVAGMFYPTPSAALLRCVDDLLATAGAADTAAATPHPPWFTDLGSRLKAFIGRS